MERLIGIGDAAQALGVSITTLRRWEATGKRAVIAVMTLPSSNPSCFMQQHRLIAAPLPMHGSLAMTRKTI